MAPVPVEAVWGRTPADAVDFILSRTPGRTVTAATRASLEEAFRPHATEYGVRMRAGVWLVTACARPRPRSPRASPAPSVPRGRPAPRRARSPTRSSASAFSAGISPSSGNGPFPGAGCDPPTARTPPTTKAATAPQIPPARVPVAPFGAVQIGEVEGRPPHHPVVGDQDFGDRAEQSAHEAPGRSSTRPSSATVWDVTSLSPARAPWGRCRSRGVRDGRRNTSEIHAQAPYTGATRVNSTQVLMWSVVLVSAGVASDLARRPVFRPVAPTILRPVRSYRARGVPQLPWSA